MREQVELLEHHADLAADRLDILRIRAQRDTGDDDLAALVLLQPVDAADHRRLPGAGRPADHDAFALVDLEIDVLEDVELAEPFVDMAQLDDRRPRSRIRHARRPLLNSRSSIWL